MRLLSRYPGRLSRNTIGRLVARPKPAWSSSLRVQTRMAHEVSLPDDWKLNSLDRATAFSSDFSNLFRRSPPDLPDQLLAMITPDPGLLCALGLSSAVYWADSLDLSIRSVVQVLPRTADFLIYKDNDRLSFQDAVKSFASLTVWTDLRKLYTYQPRQATDPYSTLQILNAALFSASAVKNGLLDEVFISVFTRYGLQLPASEPFEGERKEVAAIGAVGACLQLITAGSVFMEKHFVSSDTLADIIGALEALRAKSPISHTRVLELLDKTIEAAKGHFTNPLSASDAWNILVPQPEGFDGRVKRMDQAELVMKMFKAP